VNPSNLPKRRVTESTRIPMSTPEQQLKVPDIPGYHLHWHLEHNIQRALAAGYEFVEDDQVLVTDKGVANNKEETGSTDLGSKISILADRSNGGSRLYLMKLKEEWWMQDQKKQLEVSESIAATMRSGTVGADKDPDVAKRYLKTGQDLFIPKHR